MNILLGLTNVKLNEKLQFPLTSNIDEQVVLEISRMIWKLIIYTYIDNIGLEDLITFHEAEFDIIDGCQFSSDRTNAINNVINNLYD